MGTRAVDAAEHLDWVERALRHMLSVKTGMTRAELLRVFAEEGGLSSGLERTYGYRECGYFKVRVRFEPVGRPALEPDGRASLDEDPRDVIVELSKPFLAYPVMD